MEVIQAGHSVNVGRLRTPEGMGRSMARRGLPAPGVAVWGLSRRGGLGALPGTNAAARRARLGWADRAGDREGAELGQVRRQAEGDHALPLRRIGAGDDRDGHDITAVDRQVRNARRNVHEVAGLDHCALPQARAVPHLRLAADGIDGG